MKNMTRFVSTVIAWAALFSAPSAFAAFTGNTTILVNGSTFLDGGLNAGVQFAQPGNPLNFLDGLVISASGTLASNSGGSAVPTGFTDANPFVDLDIASIGVGDSLMSYGDVLLTFDSLIAVVPTSGINTNGSVDYAGMGTMTYQGGEATDIFWHYNVAGGSVGVVLDAQGSASSGYTAFAAMTVPVPAAAWLFGSALAGMCGLRRFKSVLKIS